MEQIDEAVLMSQIEDAIQPETRARVFLMGQATAEEEKAYERKRTQQLKIGLPDVRDPKRQEKIEGILQEMVQEGKLVFYPPDKYSIRR